MKLHVGVVGLGTAWDRRYRSALRAVSDRFEVRAVCEPVAHRAEAAAKEFRALAVDGFRALCRRADIDAILYLCPQFYGPLPILAACESGKAIYCVNGFDLDLQRADEIKRRVEESGIAFMAECVRRHSPATARLKELIATRLGKPRLLFCHVRIAVEKGVSPLEQPAPVHELMELVDVVRYVVGRDPTSVFAMAHGQQQWQFNGDYQMMSLNFADPDDPTNLACAQISVGRYMPAEWQEAVTFRPPADLQVSCEHGIAFVDLPDRIVWFDTAGRHMESLESERPVGEIMLSNFYRNVTSLVRKTQSLEDTYRALRVVMAARQSHQEQRRVTLQF